MVAMVAAGVLAGVLELVERAIGCVVCLLVRRKPPA